MSIFVIPKQRKVLVYPSNPLRQLADRSKMGIHSLILNHPFEDGNKRTGFFTVNAFLLKNGFKLKFTKGQALKFCLDIENKSLDLKKIASWLKKHSKK